VYLLKHFANLGIELRGGMEDKALENQADGVQRGGADEDGEAGEHAEASSKASGDARLAEAGAVEAHRDDRSGDEPEEREKRNRWKGEGNQGECGGYRSRKAGDLDGTAPDDRIAGSEALGNLLGERIRGGLLRADLLINLFTQLFGELDLRCSAVPAIDKGALLFAMQDGVTTGTETRTHYSEG